MEERDAVIAGLVELNEGYVEAMTVEVNRKIGLLEAVLAGETSEEVPEGLVNTFSGVIFDENEDYPFEVSMFRKWLDEIIGDPIEELPEKIVLISPDGSTRVVVYDKAVGEVGYYLSKWVNEGEKPTYIFWPWEMYEGQLESGFVEETR